MATNTAKMRASESGIIINELLNALREVLKLLPHLDPSRRRTLLDEINQSESSPGVQTKKKGDNRQVDGKIAYSSVSDVVVVELKLNANGKEVHCSARELKPSVSILSNLQLEFSTGHINVWPRVSLSRLHLFAL